MHNNCLCIYNYPISEMHLTHLYSVEGKSIKDLLFIFQTVWKYEVFCFMYNSAEIIYLLSIAHSSNGKKDCTSNGSVKHEKYEIVR